MFPAPTSSKRIREVVVNRQKGGRLQEGTPRIAVSKKTEKVKKRSVSLLIANRGPVPLWGETEQKPRFSAPRRAKRVIGLEKKTEKRKKLHPNHGKPDTKSGQTNQQKKKKQKKKKKRNMRVEIHKQKKAERGDQGREMSLLFISPGQGRKATMSPPKKGFQCI